MPFPGKDERTLRRLRSWTNSNSNTLQFHPVRKPSTIRKEILKKKSKRLTQKSVLHIHLDEQLICKKLLPLLLNSVAISVYLYPLICCHYYWYSVPSRTVNTRELDLKWEVLLTF